MLIYAVIAAFGLIVLLSMLVFGDIFGDHDIDHGGFEHGGFDHDGADAGGPSILSVRVMSAFVTAFGVGGVVARFYNLSHPAASGVGVVSGVAMSGIVYQFAKILYSQQASSEIRMGGLIGATAEVSVAIPEGGVGQVSLSSGGERTDHIARSADGRPVSRGTTVVITGLGAQAVVVKPADMAGTGASR
jgi:membrane protein implicated in regulation of membrane protease activity